MGSFTHYGANRYLDHLFGGSPKGTFAPYLGVFLTSPSETSPGSEPVGGNYSRTALSPSDFAVTGALAQQVADLKMARATAPWGTVIGLGLWDSSVAGNCWAYFNAVDFEVIEERDSLIVLAGGLTHSFVDGGLSLSVKTRILNDLYKAVPLALYPTLYASYHTASGSDAAMGAEVSAGGYSRLAVANNFASFSPATGGQKANAALWQWPLSTASQGTVVEVGLWSASSGGEFIARGTVPPTPIAENNWFGIAAGDASISLD